MDNTYNYMSEENNANLSKIKTLFNELKYTRQLS